MTENQYQRANRMVLITILIVFGFIAVTVLAALGVSKGEQPGRIIIQFITALIVMTASIAAYIMKKKTHKMCIRDRCGCGHHHDHDHHDHEHDHDGECGCGHHHDHHHHHADDVFTSWGVETAHKFTEEELTEILHKLAETKDYGDVLRAKGIVAAAEGEWFHFDLVPEETEVRRGAADFTGRICVIGADLKEDAIKELFHVA